MSNFQGYTGWEGNQEKGLSCHVVKDLTQPFQQSNICCYMDNFYTGADLLEVLRCKIYTCGTVCSNHKGLPKNLFPINVQNLQKGEFRVAQKWDLTFAIWKDTKPDLVLSNFSWTYSRKTCQPKRYWWQTTANTCSSHVKDYQNHMKEVYILKQMIGYYMPLHRSRKWWCRLFFYFLMVTVYNVHVISKRTHPHICKDKWPSLKEFIQDLVLELIGETRTTRQVAVPPIQNCTSHYIW